MSLRPTLLSKWIPRPSEILRTKPSIHLHLTRPSPARPSLTFPSATHRTLSTVRSQTTRFTRSRTGPSPFPRQRRYNSNSSSGSGAKGPESKDTGSLSARLKKLTREYGWAALGVYLGLSALDFPFCFAAVRLLGVERIGYYEHVVIGFVKDKLKSVWPQAEASDGEGELAQAEERNEEEASIWTQLVFAYALHKSFIFIRVPLTAAVTPKVVKMLRRWGWDIGKRTPKST
ncbi:hypothetical protein N7457_002395 [Penicillium paradoxum]|uniref:uncharacterized protein n=1 Tax=Penicillium paradoxum TaxID=176176 RepID=UPI0025488FC0|nr:uncharacterized protein N7457_002395 [Penicillium paradoxum]KAJ5787405.1 hypothetical protein N7457_002395 [Penicillium paradoxum]